jgi:uncharacterized protein (TIGR00255 family)
MTGFGRADVNLSGYQIVCEIKGVNHRFLDLNVRMSRRYSTLEDRIREKVKQYIVRGRVDIFLNIGRTADSERNIKVDKELAMIYHESLKELAINLQIPSNISIMDVAQLPEVISLEDQEEDLELLWQALATALDEALTSLTLMRKREGQALVTDILERNGVIREAMSKIEERSPLVVQDHAERMKKRLAEMLGEVGVDESRLAQEIAIFADRASITEEIIRMNSHCHQLEKLLQAQESVGRKCDFLIQEMFREVNTIASKANDLEIGKMVVELKAELEKIREQVQNIE